jgi:hypothetical protein
MTAITFDTLKFANRLKAAGVPPAQAEAEAEALSEVFETGLNELTTRADLRELGRLLGSEMDQRFAKMEQRFSRVDQQFTEQKGELLLLKWMMGVIVAGVIALVMKAFF